MSIASEAVAGWGTWGHRCDFLMHIYLISLNAFDLPLNVWPPECVFHDTDPLQLLRSNCCLPMGSLVGMSTEGVKLILHMNLWRPNNVSYTYIYIWPSVKTAFYDLISASIAFNFTHCPFLALIQYFCGAWYNLAIRSMKTNQVNEHWTRPNESDLILYMYTSILHNLWWNFITVNIKAFQNLTEIGIPYQSMYILSSFLRSYEVWKF